MHLYELSDGTLVPGVTTILSLLAKPQLIEWAWQQGLQGNDIHAIKEEAADIGTIAHGLIVRMLKGESIDLESISENAKTPLKAFLKWRENKVIEPILIETSLVSHRYYYGGTLDFYGYINNELVLCDWKTTNTVQNTFLIQTAAYRHLLIENGYRDPSRVLVVRFDKNSIHFEEVSKENTDIEFEIFKRLAEMYHLLKEVGYDF